MKTDLNPWEPEFEKEKWGIHGDSSFYKTCMYEGTLSAQDSLQ